ncbi:hydrogenase expression/formation protein HypE [Streptomyces xiamenensis]|uniref:hydrogenase expression/formation protein HypE n=1 Tax=Streptomyces TaxID=1883 RepID=UPI000B13350F|nr:MULTISPECIES: hydrogenase expression/formation protein HypE [Streptomyces]
MNEQMAAPLNTRAPQCPVPRPDLEQVLLGHGAGGRLTAELLDSVVLPALAGEELRGPLEDAADIPGEDGLVITTDGFVVSPLFFPGGDIGSLAVHGTVNDLAMRGAEPIALTVAVVIEEGMELDELRAVLTSLGTAARAAGLPVLAGDTKVVQRGHADKVFITTTGLGRRIPGLRPSAAGARDGDTVLLSGPIGAHGTAVLSTREQLGFTADIVSDSRPLHRLVRALAPLGEAVHTLRDPTRGGLAAALNEIALDSGVQITLDETALPIPGQVAAACGILGLDPLHVANEGCLVAFVPHERAQDALRLMRSRPEGVSAVSIGQVNGTRPGRVVIRTAIGGERTVDMPLGEQLPRIC